MPQQSVSTTASVPVDDSDESDDPAKIDAKFKRIIKTLPRDWATSIKRIIGHDMHVNESWQNLYTCTSFFPESYIYFVPNRLDAELEYFTPPSDDKPVPVPVVSEAPVRESSFGYCNHYSDKCEWLDSERFVIAGSLVRTFLGVVHPFTTLGLEAQATAFSYGDKGVIKYLAIFPQNNAKSSVSDVPSDVTDWDAVSRFQAHDQTTSADGYLQRCWIYTHPSYPAFMSSVDIYQMYRCETSGPAFSFSMVISPRIKGLKVLVVRLTEAGKREIAR